MAYGGAELGRNPVSKDQIQPEYGDEQADAERDCRQILRRERGQGKKVNFPCSANHEQAWQRYPVDPYSCYVCDQTYTSATIPGITPCLETHLWK